MTTRRSEWALALAVALQGMTAAAQTTDAQAAERRAPAATSATGGSPAEAEANSELAVVPGGLTADQVAARAIRESFQMRAQRANIEAADAARTEAGRQMIPNLTLQASYTRLSDITPPTLNFGGGTSALTQLASSLCIGTGGELYVGVPLSTGTQCPGTSRPASPPSGSTGSTNSGFSFPVILDQIAFRGTITVPITDLPFRIARVYEAAGLTAEARRLDAEAARMQVGADARVSFYEYIRARGQRRVAEQGLAAAQRSREDIARFVEAGTLPRVELLRVEARVADAERMAILARNGVVLAEAVLRQRIHARDGEPFALGESLEEPLEVPPSLQDLLQRAWHDRPELRSLDRQLRALDANLSATRAGTWPSVVGQFNAEVSSPNQRFVPQTTDFNATWSASLVAQWSPTAALVNTATTSRIAAQRDAVEANLAALREGLELEVRNTFTAAQGARASIDAARRQQAAAEETYRVSRERFNAGAAVSRDLTEAETALVQARLAVVNAHVDLRIALARLRRAAGQHESE